MDFILIPKGRQVIKIMLVILYWCLYTSIGLYDDSPCVCTLEHFGGKPTEQGKIVDCHSVKL